MSVAQAFGSAAAGCSQPEAATLLQLGGAAVAEIWVFSVIKCFLVSNYKILNKHQWSTSPNYRYGSSSTVWTDINKGAFIGNAWAEAKIQDLQFRAACQVLQSWKFGTLNNELLEKPIEYTAINELLEKSNWIHGYLSITLIINTASRERVPICSGPFSLSRN